MTASIMWHFLHVHKGIIDTLDLADVLQFIWFPQRYQKVSLVNWQYSVFLWTRSYLYNVFRCKLHHVSRPHLFCFAFSSKQTVPLFFSKVWKYSEVPEKTEYIWLLSKWSASHVNGSIFCPLLMALCFMFPNLICRSDSSAILPKEKLCREAICCAVNGSRCYEQLVGLIWVSEVWTKAQQRGQVWPSHSIGMS